MTIFGIKCEYYNMTELSIITSKPLEALKLEDLQTMVGIEFGTGGSLTRSTRKPHMQQLASLATRV